MESMVPMGGRSPGCSSLFLRFRWWEGSWPVSSALKPAADESVESTSPNELLDLVLELDAFLRVVAVVAVVEAELVGVRFSRCVRILSGLGSCSLTSISTWAFEALRGA